MGGGGHDRDRGERALSQRHEAQRAGGGWSGSEQARQVWRAWLGEAGELGAGCRSQAAEPIFYSKGARSLF